jgi:hypothetical protein
VRSWLSFEQRAYPINIAAIPGLYRLSYLDRALKRTGLTGIGCDDNHGGFIVAADYAGVFR